MPRRILLTVIALGAVSVVAAAAEEPKSVPADRVIGRVYGKPITAGDVGLVAPIDVGVKLDASDRARWEQMSRVQKALGLPIQERFVSEKKLAVTDEEIALFKATSQKLEERSRKAWNERLAAIAQELAAANLTAEKADKLRKEQKVLEKWVRPVPPMSDSQRRFSDSQQRYAAEVFILPWKIERELQRTYGGRIIFQQFGLEALDARRKLYEAAEAAGDLKFEDPGVRHLFYYYADMRHTLVDDDKALEKKPWFLEAVE